MISTVRKISVTLNDGVTTEEVELRRLTLRQVYTYIEKLGGKASPELVAMCVGKPVEWVDTLSDESFAELAKVSFSENFQRAVTLAKEDPVAAGLIAPFLLLANAARGMGGDEKLLNSASSESAGETPTESSISLPTGSISSSLKVVG